MNNRVTITWTTEINNYLLVATGNNYLPMKCYITRLWHSAFSFIDDNRMDKLSNKVIESDRQPVQTTIAIC